MSDAINKPAHYNQGPIECIDAMQQILTPEEFRGFLKGNVFKYLWREKGKNGIEDLRKGKDYYDRLIQSFDKNEAEQLVTEEVAVEVTGEVKPPYGWRFLERGEVIRKGDKPRDGIELRLLWVGTPCANNHFILRRNRFEVGEKVVHVDDSRPTQYAIAGYNESLGAYAIKYKEGEYLYHPSKLAPYIEETT